MRGAGRLDCLFHAGDRVIDFTAGAGGDAVDLTTLLSNLGYSGADAFADGWVRTVQSGAHTLVQIDADGGGDGFATLATLENLEHIPIN